jgi:hypothetical protein
LGEGSVNQLTGTPSAERWIDKPDDGYPVGQEVDRQAERRVPRRRGDRSASRAQLASLVVDRYDRLQVLAAVVLGKRKADELLLALRSAVGAGRAVVDAARRLRRKPLRQTPRRMREVETPPCSPLPCGAVARSITMPPRRGVAIAKPRAISGFLPV